MKYNYQNIAISKDFYKSGEGFPNVWSVWILPSSTGAPSLPVTMRSSDSSSDLTSRCPVRTATVCRNFLRPRTAQPSFLSM